MIASLSGKKMNYEYSDQARQGDHICYISNLEKIQAHYPRWHLSKNLETIFVEIHQAWLKRRKEQGTFRGLSSVSG